NSQRVGQIGQKQQAGHRAEAAGSHAAESVSGAYGRRQGLGHAPDSNAQRACAGRVFLLWGSCTSERSPRNLDAQASMSLSLTVLRMARMRRLAVRSLAPIACRRADFMPLMS